MKNNRAIKLAIGYSIHSLIPIVGWWLWGIIEDPDYISVWTLTYPLQFIWETILLIFGYGIETYSLLQKDDKNNIALTGLILGCISYIVVFTIIGLNATSYTYMMGYRDNKYILPCLFSILQFILSGIASLLSSYFNFEENYTSGKNVLIIYNLIAYPSLIISLLIFKDIVISIIISIVLPSIYLLIKLFKIIKQNIYTFKIKVNILEPIKLVLVELSEQAGLLITYIFGIGNLASNNFSIMITFTVWTQVIDWIWDAQSNVIPTIIRIDTATERFNFKQSLKEILPLDVIFVVLIVVQLIILYPFFHFSITWIIIFSIFDISDLILHVFRTIEVNYLITRGKSKIAALHESIGYVIRITLTIGISTLLSMFIAQLAAGVYKTITNTILYVRHTKTTKDASNVTY